MAVEIYFEKELSDITFEVEALQEWKQIAEELGMSEQLELTKGKETPVPYPYINTHMERVYETLCPVKVDYRKYKNTPIPLEVLKQISFSVKDNHFNKIEIWYDDKQPDPFAIGYIGYYYVYDHKYNTIKDPEGNEFKFDTEKEAMEFKNEGGFYSVNYRLVGRYCIARWGDELKPFAELKKIALERLIELAGSDIKRELNTYTEKLKNITTNAEAYLLGTITRHDLMGRY